MNLLNKGKVLKKTLYCGFAEDVKSWLSDAGQPYAIPNTKEHLDNLSVADSEEIKPGDSISNVSRSRSSHLKSRSQLSHVSTTSSAKAEKAALMERVTA